MKNFNELSEREILALAISLEEEDERVYADFSEGLRQEFPASATVFDSMRNEESGHRRRLIELYQQKFGEHIPLIRRQDVKGFVQRTPVWLLRPLGLDTVRKQASAIEVETRRFYERAAARTQDASVRQLLDDLAQEERSHEDRAQELTEEKLRPDVKEDEDKARRRLFVLQIVQPGLAGLMDGSGFDFGSGVCGGPGRIVNVSSVTGPISSNPRETAYSAAKAGMVGLTRGLALEVARQGITVNAVAPAGSKPRPPPETKSSLVEILPSAAPAVPTKSPQLSRFSPPNRPPISPAKLIIVDGGNAIQEYKGPPDLYY